MAQTQLEIFEEFFTTLREEVVKNYDKLGLRASGRFANKLEVKLDVSSKLNGKLLAPHYATQMVQGRKPSTSGEDGSLTTIIRKWIDDKRIQPKGISKDSLAFLISRKIIREGIKVPNEYNAGTLLSDVITKSKIDGLINKLKGYWLFRAQSELAKVLKEVA